MAKIKPQIDTSMEMLPGLFDSATAEGALDIDLGLRQCFSRVMHNMHALGKDRYQIAAEMSRLMKSNVTKEMLDKYAASDQGNAMKVNMLAAFCFVCNTFEPMQYLLKALGSDVLRPEDCSVLEWARLKRESKSIDQRIKQLESTF